MSCRVRGGGVLKNGIRLHQTEILVRREYGGSIDLHALLSVLTAIDDHDARGYVPILVFSLGYSKLGRFATETDDSLWSRKAFQRRFF